MTTWLASAQTDTDDKYQEYQQVLESYDPAEMLQRQEVINAIKFGKGISRTHRISSMIDEYYYAIRLTPQKILLIQTAESSLLAWYTSMLPTLVLNLVIILIVSYLISVIATKRLVTRSTACHSVSITKRWILTAIWSTPSWCRLYRRFICSACATAGRFPSWQRKKQTDCHYERHERRNCGFRSIPKNYHG